MNHTIFDADDRALERTMSHITANELKTRGIAAIEAQLAEGRTEAVVTVRGADRYVVMELAHYQHLRECELEAAAAESRADLAAGRFVVEPPQQHVARLQAMIAAADAATRDADASDATNTARDAGPAAAPRPAARRRSGAALVRPSRPEAR
jgi:hypothetical protein